MKKNMNMSKIRNEPGCIIMVNNVVVYRMMSIRYYPNGPSPSPSYAGEETRNGNMFRNNINVNSDGRLQDEYKNNELYNQDMRNDDHDRNNNREDRCEYYSNTNGPLDSRNMGRDNADYYNYNLDQPPKKVDQGVPSKNSNGRRTSNSNNPPPNDGFSSSTSSSESYKHRNLTLGDRNRVIFLFFFVSEQRKK